MERLDRVDVHLSCFHGSSSRDKSSEEKKKRPEETGEAKFGTTLVDSFLAWKLLCHHRKPVLVPIRLPFNILLSPHVEAYLSEEG